MTFQISEFITRREFGALAAGAVAASVLPYTARAADAIAGCDRPDSNPVWDTG